MTFGFNTRMVNQYVEASIIIMMEECLKRDPLYNKPITLKMY